MHSKSFLHQIASTTLILII